MINKHIKRDYKLDLYCWTALGNTLVGLLSMSHTQTNIVRLFKVPSAIPKVSKSLNLVLE